MGTGTGKLGAGIWESGKSNQIIRRQNKERTIHKPHQFQGVFLESQCLPAEEGVNQDKRGERGAHQLGGKKTKQTARPLSGTLREIGKKGRRKIGGIIPTHHTNAMG